MDMSELEKLHSLKEKGVVTEEEFAKAKADFMKQNSAGNNTTRKDVKNVSASDSEWPGFMKATWDPKPYGGRHLGLFWLFGFLSFFVPIFGLIFGIIELTRPSKVQKY